MSIPKARKLLLKLAKDEGREDIADIVNNYMFRKPPIRRAPPKVKNGLTIEQKQLITYLAETFVHMPMREIARRADTDQGRVSEFLNAQARAA